MTNANEMAQKGFDTGFTDANDNELHVGDYVRICGHIGKIVFSCGAFGIFIADEVPWDALEELVRKDSGNRPSFLYNDTFISFWEIVWNLSEDTDEPCLPYVESITVTGGIFTDENGNKDVFMGCINGCSAISITLTASTTSIESVMSSLPQIILRFPYFGKGTAKMVFLVR